VKRPFLMLAVPAVAIAIAVLTHRAEPTPGKVATPRAAAPAPASTAGTTWVATAPARAATRPEAPAARPAPPHPAGPKPDTESRRALMESQMPALAVATLEQAESPRQRLLERRRGPSETRLAQVDSLRERSEGALTRLREARATATGEERARIERAIHAIERNQGFRTRILGGRTPPPPGRTGTGGGPVPQFEKMAH
jgi:hypothetical protein